MHNYRREGDDPEDPNSRASMPVRESQMRVARYKVGDLVQERGGGNVYRVTSVHIDPNRSPRGELWYSLAPVNGQATGEWRWQKQLEEASLR